MIGRMIWWSALAVVAMVALFAQLDRATRFSPGLERLVPASFSAFAAERRAEATLAAARDTAPDSDLMIAQSRALIAARPVPAEHLSLLAQGYIYAGQSDAALATLQAASTRGWRAPVVQLAAAQAALASGDMEAAAQRITALLATGSLPEHTPDLIAQLLTTPQGRAAFADRLASQGRWQANVLRPAAGAADPADMAEMLALALAAGTDLPCAALREIATDYQEAGLTKEAARFWPADCG